MGNVIINAYTTKEPLTMIGVMAGICWESPTDDDIKNVKRAISCIDSGHGRVMEFPDIYLTLDGYSAKVMREWYTHIGGSPSRLQSSTRYVDSRNFKYVTPPSVKMNPDAKEKYDQLMKNISQTYAALICLGIPKEDASMLLPLGMESKMVDKCNLRHLTDMSRQRMCSRAFWEYRQMFNDIRRALSDYSPQWKWLVESQFYAKCGKTHLCYETKGCGKFPSAPAPVDSRDDLIHQMENDHVASLV